MKYLITFIFILYSSFSIAKVTKIIVWDSLYNDPNSIVLNYLYKALEITKAEYGNYEIIGSIPMEQGRSLKALSIKNGFKLDIASYAPTREREIQAIPIRIPLLSGLMGYRLCLINDKNQSAFNGIKNKKQLIERGISIGQHQDWPDTTILRSNNINVQTTHKKALLFQQLSRKRFDCFSRGASEIYAEYLAHQKQGIKIEKKLLIYYPLPLFFFVNKNHPLLAERLQLGLEKLIKSGEFDNIFKKYYADIIIELKLNNRTVIDLNNPTLSEQTIKALQGPTLRFRKNYLTNIH